MKEKVTRRRMVMAAGDKCLSPDYLTGGIGMQITGTNPVSGDKVSLTNPRTWVSYVIGAGFLFFVFNLWQFVFQKVAKRAPGVTRFGADMPFMDAPTQVISGNITTVPITNYGEAI